MISARPRQVTIPTSKSTNTFCFPHWEPRFRFPHNLKLGTVLVRSRNFFCFLGSRQVIKLTSHYISWSFTNFVWRFVSSRPWHLERPAQYLSFPVSESSSWRALQYPVNLWIINVRWRQFILVPVFQVVLLSNARTNLELRLGFQRHSRIRGVLAGTRLHFLLFEGEIDLVPSWYRLRKRPIQCWLQEVMAGTWGSLIHFQCIRSWCWIMRVWLLNDGYYSSSCMSIWYSFCSTETKLWRVVPWHNIDSHRVVLTRPWHYFLCLIRKFQKIIPFGLVQTRSYFRESLYLVTIVSPRPRHSLLILESEIGISLKSKWKAEVIMLMSCWSIHSRPGHNLFELILDTVNSRTQTNLRSFNCLPTTKHSSQNFHLPSMVCYTM